MASQGCKPCPAKFINLRRIYIDMEELTKLSEAECLKAEGVRSLALIIVFFVLYIIIYIVLAKVTRKYFDYKLGFSSVAIVACVALFATALMLILLDGIAGSLIKIFLPIYALSCSGFV